MVRDNNYKNLFLYLLLYAAYFLIEQEKFKSTLLASNASKFNFIHLHNKIQCQGVKEISTII